MPYTEGNRNRMKSLSKETPENLKHPYERMISKLFKRTFTYHSWNQMYRGGIEEPVVHVRTNKKRRKT